MIGWGVIAYGATLSALVAGLLVAAAARTHRVTAGLGAAVGAAIGAVAWNAILHAAHGDEFFTDAPITVFPASWQDTGSGVFALASTALVLGLGPLADQTARRTVALSVVAGLAAFLVDVYLY